MIAPVFNKNNKQIVTSMQLSTEHVVLDILHIGKISNYLQAFFETVNITFKTIKIKELNAGFDIVLINNDSDTKEELPSAVNDTKLKVIYTKTKSFLNRGTDFIDSSLIPVLLKYLLKIKRSFHVLKDIKNKNSIDIFLRKVEDVIDEHIDDHSLNMERLSYLLSMSRSAFSKKIKEYTGLKPTEYVNEYKLEKSKHFLIITNWQVSRISDVLGFSSQHYYCRLFKKKEGVSPSQYRINKRKPNSVKYRLNSSKEN
ncbi:hypothetical protein A8C32_01775 [Flavivirga aquatica]|uniref:HTH araC/xylS-type domain-containing protein n=1 Tax=Flavivirga aquatica TaxID=1849968 RepID=A0A1E5TA81_9FLAO|nr:AraC family transcriptional regulator [Flavivirga aquatica]OEK08217.1 hypothetical protein A8C32_01775 [Flavivirga aquatica]